MIWSSNLFGPPKMRKFGRGGLWDDPHRFKPSLSVCSLSYAVRIGAFSRSGCRQKQVSRELGCCRMHGVPNIAVLALTRATGYIRWYCHYYRPARDRISYSEVSEPAAQSFNAAELVGNTTKSVISTDWACKACRQRKALFNLDALLQTSQAEGGQCKCHGHVPSNSQAAHIEGNDLLSRVFSH